MANYAVVEISGKQYKATPGSELLVDRLAVGKGKTTFDRVLLLVDEADVKIGTPAVSGTSVVATILGEEKGDKVTVVKFRAKSRYRRKNGFRAFLTRIKIESIGKVEKPAKEPKQTPKLSTKSPKRISKS